MTDKISLQVTYRGGHPLAAYVYLGSNGRRRAVRSKEVGPELVVDYAADGSPLGIEILSPRSVTLEQLWAVFDGLGLERPSAEELKPLAA